MCNIQAGGRIIKVAILGSAAGGGLPQWNCACEGCRNARAGAIPQRTQTCVAVSADGLSWFLVNASPDLRSQLLGWSCFHPPDGSNRGTMIEGILLANADLDHVLGVALLRESDEPVHLHASARVREELGWMEDLLRPFCGVVWHDLAGLDEVPLLTNSGDASGLIYHSISTSAPGNGKDSEAFVFDDSLTNQRLLIASDVAAVSDELALLMNTVNMVIWDGTFWREDELSRWVPGKRSASAMGHLALSSGGFEALRICSAQTKLLIHMNNTNPVLLADSQERALVEAAGIIVAEDGMIFEL